MRLTFSPGTRAELKQLVLSAVPDAEEGGGGLKVVDLEPTTDLSVVDPSALVLCGGTDAAKVISLWEHRQLRHLMLPEAPAVELSAVLRRMETPSAGGFADLLGPTHARHVWPAHDSSKRGDILQDVGRRSGVAGASRRSVERLVGIAEELITNALYDAPVDAAGRHLHAHKPRTERVTTDEAAVRVELADDDQRVALVVRDRFGSLSAKTAFDNLARCMRAGRDQVADKAGGAGLGLFTALSAANHLVITVGPALTEVVAIVDKRVTRPTGRCFNWFEVAHG